MTGVPHAWKPCAGLSGSDGCHKICRAQRVIADAGIHLDRLGEKEVILALGEPLGVQRLNQHTARALYLLPGQLNVTRAPCGKRGVEHPANLKSHRA